MIGATIRKDTQLLLRDRGRLLMLFVMPIVFIVVFGSMFKFGPDQANRARSRSGTHPATRVVRRLRSRLQRRRASHRN